MKYIPRKTLTVTLTNHGGPAIKKGSTYCYGIPPSEFPLCTPGAKFRVAIDYIGSDDSMKPELHAFIPHSQFGGWIQSAKLDSNIAECRRALKNPRRHVASKPWWKARLQNLLIDQKNYKQAIKDHRAAVRFWKKNLPK